MCPVVGTYQYGNVVTVYNKEDYITSASGSSSVSSLFRNAGSNYRNFQNNRLYEKAVSQEMDALKASGSLSSDTTLRKLAENRLAKGIGSEGAEQTLSKSSKELGIAGAALQIAADTLLEGAKMLWASMKQGMTDQYNTYNNTFNNVAARTGISASNYRSRWRNTDNQLRASGLFNNIEVNDVMKMWDSLANTGASETDIFSTAIDNIVTNKIVPYLDTTTQAFNILNSRLDYNFVKEIRGISKTSMDIAGNNYATQDMLQMIIDEVQPISDEALDNLAKGSTEYTTMVNELTKTMGKEQAEAYAKRVFKVRNYGYLVVLL